MAQPRAALWMSMWDELFGMDAQGEHEEHYTELILAYVCGVEFDSQYLDRIARTAGGTLPPVMYGPKSGGTRSCADFSKTGWPNNRHRPATRREQRMRPVPRRSNSTNSQNSYGVQVPPT